MSDPRFHGPTFIGAPLTRQQKLNQRHLDYCNSHPASYGWKAIGATPDGIVVWEEKGGAGLMRHPARDCWLVFWMDCWQPIDKHISQLSEELPTIKTHIEFELFTELFAADVEAMTA